MRRGEEGVDEALAPPLEQVAAPERREVEVSERAAPQNCRVGSEHLLVGNVLVRERQPQVLLHRRLQTIRELVDGGEGAQGVRALAVRRSARVAPEDEQSDGTDDEGRERDVEEHVAHRPERLGDRHGEPVPVAHRHERRDGPVQGGDVLLGGRVQVVELVLVATDPRALAQLGVVGPRHEEHAAHGPVGHVEHEHEVAGDGDDRQGHAQVVLQVLEKDADAVETDQAQEAQQHQRASDLGARSHDRDHDVVERDQREHVHEEERSHVTARDHFGGGHEPLVRVEGEAEADNDVGEVDGEEKVLDDCLGVVEGL